MLCTVVWPKAPSLRTALPSTPKILRSLPRLHTAGAITGKVVAPAAGVITELEGKDWILGDGIGRADMPGYDDETGGVMARTVLLTAAPPGTTLASTAWPSLPRKPRSLLCLRTGAAAVVGDGVAVPDGEGKLLAEDIAFEAPACIFNSCAAGGILHRSSSSASDWLRFSIFVPQSPMSSVGSSASWS